MATIRRGTEVRHNEGMTGKVVAVKSVDRTVRPDGEKLYVVRCDEDGKERTWWGWELQRRGATRGA
jgi:hypothetical protein